MASLATRFIKDESAQGITEYGGLLGFVAVIIVLCAGFLSGGLRNSLSQSYSLILSAVDNLTTQAS